MNAIRKGCRLLSFVLLMHLSLTLIGQTTPAPAPDSTTQTAQSGTPVIRTADQTQKEKKDDSLLIGRKVIIDYKTWSIRLVKEEE